MFVYSSWLKNDKDSLNFRSLFWMHNKNLTFDQPFRVGWGRTCLGESGSYCVKNDAEEIFLHINDLPSKQYCHDKKSPLFAIETVC